ncbi:MAG TPA: uroporphyrinogen decarboxylase [Opitutaceae bacterium]|nr:uroporphyrinogen decarboxylase [Opitutaceae bacterium]
MTSRERFLAACACQPLERPPLWIMRQAGRYLPEYRALKAKHNFLKMVRTPDLAAEVTMQPMRRFPQLDAAIVFSDILVIPEALGQGYRFKEEGGIAMDWRVERWEQVDRLTVELVPERLRYVPEALKRVREQLGPDRALLGFCGSPWTLAAYMVEGEGSDDFARAKALLYGDRPLFDKLMEKLVRALVSYVRMQIEAGADAVQIFDSWAGILPAAEYEQASLRWTRQLIAALPKGFPVILYAKGAAPSLPALGASGATVLGLDWTIDLATARRALPAGVAVQGNLDPVLLNTTPANVATAAEKLLGSMRGLPGHIFNLGHGILPEAKIDCFEALCSTVAGWRG